MKGSDFGGQRLEISKELEAAIFRHPQKNHLYNVAKEGSTKHWISDDSRELVSAVCSLPSGAAGGLDNPNPRHLKDVICSGAGETENSGDDDTNKTKDQFTSFQKAMKMVIIWGQCIGLIPVTGILQKDVSKMRFTRWSLQYLFAMTVAIVQIIATMLSMYRLYNYPNVGVLGSVTYLMPVCLTTISFIKTAPKWPPLMNELSNSRLDEYIHPYVVKRCTVACAVYMGMGLLEHIMALLSRLVHIIECQEGIANVGEVFVKGTSPWLYELNVPYDVWLGSILQCLNVLNTATWNYLDIFIVCISLYLTSIMQQINKKIILTASKSYVPECTWEVLREDHNRATKLIKLFDDVFSGSVLIAFANDLFSVCLQLYNVLQKVVRSSQIIDKICPGHDLSLFRIYVFPAYVTYSTSFLIVRFLTLALVASDVHSSSLVSLPVLYAVPTTTYCKQVERFQNQVKSGTVALSGMRFFYITRDLVLKVAGTIVTYELVLLQFSKDDK